MKRIAALAAVALVVAAVVVPAASAKPLPTGAAGTTATSSWTSHGTNWAGIGVAAGFVIGLVAIVVSERRRRDPDDQATVTTEPVAPSPPAPQRESARAASATRVHLPAARPAGR